MEVIELVWNEFQKKNNNKKFNLTQKHIENVTVVVDLTNLNIK